VVFDFLFKKVYLYKIMRKTSIKIRTIFGTLCFLFPLSLFIFWIYAFINGNNPYNRVMLMNNFLPEFLHNNWSKTSLSLIFSILAIYLSGTTINQSLKFWKFYNLLILIFSVLLLTLNLYFIL